MTHNIQATVFVYKNKTDGSIRAEYIDGAMVKDENWIHLATLEPRMWIQHHWEDGHLSYADLERKILQWSKDRQIIPNSTPQAQFLKAVSEIGELADAVNKRDMDAIKDAVGDTLVCLINMCALLEIEVTDCLAGAYEEIKDRKGTLLPSGVFVKE